MPVAQGCEGIREIGLLPIFFVYREEGDYEKNTICMEICKAVPLSVCTDSAGCGCIVLVYAGCTADHILDDRQYH